MKPLKIFSFLLLILFYLANSFYGQSKDEASKKYSEGIDAFYRGSYQEALNYFEGSLSICKKITDETLMANNHSYIAEIYRTLKKFDQSLTHYHQALKLCKKLNNLEGLASNLNNLGVAYSQQKQHTKALLYYNRALEMVEKLNLPEKIATTHDNIGYVYFDSFKFHEALKHFEYALRLRKENNVSIQSIKNTLKWISKTFSKLGQNENALEYKEMADNINEEIEDNAIRLYIKGENLFQEGKYHEALDFFEKAALTYKTLEKKDGNTNCLNYIGKCYLNLGQYIGAKVYFETVLEIKKNNKASVQSTVARVLSDQSIADTLNNLGMVLTHLGEYEKALSYLEDSLVIYRNLPTKSYIAPLMSNISAINHSLGRYKKAIYHLEEALRIARKFEDFQGVSSCLNGLGTIYHSYGRYEKALTYYNKALKIRRELKLYPYIASSLHNIGTLYISTGQYEKALFNLEKGLKIYRKLKNPKGITDCLNNIGNLFFIQKKYKEAEEKFIESKPEDKDGYGIITTVPCLIELYIGTGRYKKAFNLLKRVQPIWTTGVSYRLQYHTQLGFTLKGIGRLKEASYEFFKAFSIAEELRQKIKEKISFLGAGGIVGRIRAYKGLVATLLERAINGEKIDEKFTSYGKNLSSSAFYFAEAAKARTLLEAISASHRRNDQSNIPEELKEKEQALLNLLSGVENQWEAAYKHGKEAFEALLEKKENTKKELDLLISKIKEKYPRYAALKYPTPILAEELPLRENEVLLEYAISRDATYLFKVRKGGVKKIFKIPISKEKLESLINEFLLPLHDKYKIENFSPSRGHKLYQLLLEKVLKDIFPEEKIIIVPEGILGLLPFEALVTRIASSYRDSRYVGDYYNISYCQSAAVLALNRMLKPSQAKKILFALGDPIYSEDDERYKYKKVKEPSMKMDHKQGRGSYRALATRREWGNEVVYQSLPETEDEVRAIANLFGVPPEPPDILLNSYANETQFRQVSLKDYRYLHFATHADLPGKVQGINEPFILLGQVENKRKDDGFLTMTEVLWLNLDADMVVLSACQTGRGKIMEGEGVVNFARAFQHAGARSVLVSLWEVPSYSAVEYMKHFYKNLNSGKGRSDALRLARQEIKSKYPNPFYWAVFILHGEGEPLKKPGYPSHKTVPQLFLVGWMWIILAVITILILIVFVYRRKFRIKYNK